MVILGTYDYILNVWYLNISGLNDIGQIIWQLDHMTFLGNWVPVHKSGTLVHLRQSRSIFALAHPNGAKNNLITIIENKVIKLKKMWKIKVKLKWFGFLVC